MKTLRLLWVALLGLGLLPAARAQVVTTQPVFFTAAAPVTITFDASQGNRGLNNFAGPVYIWTGVVTNLSPNNTTWRHVKSPNFGQADPAAAMTRSAGNPNVYTITFTPNMYYPGLGTENILRLGMIFKDAAGNTVGRAADGGDIFIDVYQGGQSVRLTSPGSGSSQVVPANTAVAVTGISAQATTLTLRLNGVVVSTVPNATSFSGSVTPTQAGRNIVRLTAGSLVGSVSDSAVLVVAPVVTVAPLPAGTREGANYLAGGTSVVLALTAPGKSFLYAVGDFNNFQPTAATLMNKTPDGNTWWVQLNGLTPGREYAYQYLVDGNLRVADPYTEKVLDPSNDRFIPAANYPGLTYPAGQQGIMATFQTNQPAYAWGTPATFARPAKTNLVIYELHIRDFVGTRNYQTVRDTLAYLQRLGVNCVELMPVNEFEGNDSWGYNPSFYFAPDKAYGTKNALKSLIDEAHRRGMAVVLDMVLNHSCGQSPMVQLYQSGGNPTADNPWFNQVATHPFNVCNDFNHESQFTKRFSKNVMDFWVNEYRVDGYRFDLSKGFTQRNSGSDVALWGQYDQSRINIWQDYYSHMQATRPGTYVILEHFADNSEETVLANAGMMLWGNMHGAYSEAGKGNFRTGNFVGAYSQQRGWQQPGLVAYMESHDEERNMVDALTAGLSNGAGYNIRTPATALARMELNAAFFLTIPGPKMIWQFGELGYDVSINQNGRTGPKPLRWNYQQEPARSKLYAVYANLAALKQQPAFSTGAYTYRLSSQFKSINVTSPGLNVHVVGNFGITGGAITPSFQATGRWYNYLTGDSISVANVNDLLPLGPGEYAVYTDRRLTRRVLGTRPAQALAAAYGLSVAPNPATATATLHYTLPTPGPVQVEVQNLLGQTVLALPVAKETGGAHTRELPVGTLAPGIYLVRLRADGQQPTLRLVLTK